MPDNLIPEERELADALLLIANKYGKFNDDNTGIWAGYTPASENEDNAKIGVKCGNCVFFNAPNGCSIIASSVEEGGLCRFAVLPDGAVTPEPTQIPEEDMEFSADGPCWDGYKQVGMKKGKGGKMVPNCVPVTTASAYSVGEDVNVGVEEFFQKPVYSLPDGLKEYAEENEEDYETSIELDELVPTQMTVNMSRVEEVMGSDKPIKVWMNEDGEPEIIDGHHRSVAYKVNGNKDIKAKVYEVIGFTATAGSKPAPKKDRIKGSKKNKAGSASDGKGVNFTVAITKSLEKKVKEHNEKAPNGRKVTLAKLKAVYRRGAGAFSTSHRPDQNRNSWAMARVNAFLKLVKSGKPTNPKYTTDNDLLPKMHPRHSEASTLSPIMASLVAALDVDDCPPATQDIQLNLKNRQNAIDNVGYGPLNPKEPNEEFWADKADRWNIAPEEAKTSVCGNCVFFVKTPKMLDCISSGIEQGGSSAEDADSAIDQAEMGYCEALDFKCAASRTCNAWAVGGPIE
jgi:hypothetical protein